MSYVAEVATAGFLSIASNDQFLAGSFCAFLAIINAKAQIQKNETRVEGVIQELRNSFIALRLALESNREQVLNYANLLESFNTLVYISKTIQTVVKLDNERLERIFFLKDQHEKMRRNSQLTKVAEKVTTAIHQINPLTWTCGNQTEEKSEADDDPEQLVQHKRYGQDSLVVERTQQISTELEIIRNKSFPVAKRGLLKKLLKWMMMHTYESTNMTDIELCFDALLSDARSLQASMNALAIGPYDTIANPHYFDQELERFLHWYTEGTREWLWKEIERWIEERIEAPKTYLLTSESVLCILIPNASGEIFFTI